MRRLAFVVQRYGREIMGGAEAHCLRVAEGLAGRYQVDVLTTCAQDYLTWRNHFPPGVTESGGVTIRRFPVDRPRRIRAFGRFADRLYATPHTVFDEIEWVRRQGPECSGLLRFLKTHEEQYDGFVFFTYLYYTTLLGLPLVAWKSLLQPTAHDEPPIYLDIFRPLFHLPRGLVYNTDEERQFVQGRFHNGHVPWDVIPAGVDDPTDVDPGRFRREHGIDGPFLLYLGRVDVLKGCEALCRMFVESVSPRLPGLTLLLVGEPVMAIPRARGIRALGVVDERTKWDALAAATALVMPSPRESLSLAALEAWSVRTPVLATDASPVVAGHIHRSGGGLTYEEGPELARSTERLLTDGDLRRKMGECGQRYVEEGFRWPGLLERWDRFLGKCLVG